MPTHDAVCYEVYALPWSTQLAQPGKPYPNGVVTDLQATTMINI